MKLKDRVKVIHPHSDFFGRVGIVTSILPTIDRPPVIKVEFDGMNGEYYFGAGRLKVISISKKSHPLTNIFK